MTGAGTVFFMVWIFVGCWLDCGGENVPLPPVRPPEAK